jgi:hypothetical protein
MQQRATIAQYLFRLFSTGHYPTFSSSMAHTVATYRFSVHGPILSIPLSQSFAFFILLLVQSRGVVQVGLANTPFFIYFFSLN